MVVQAPRQAKVRSLQPSQASALKEVPKSRRRRRSPSEGEQKASRRWTRSCLVHLVRGLRACAAGCSRASHPQAGSYPGRTSP
jgi:hypothetical protein